MHNGGIRLDLQSLHYARMGGKNKGGLGILILKVKRMLGNRYSYSLSCSELAEKIDTTLMYVNYSREWLA